MSRQVTISITVSLDEAAQVLNLLRQFDTLIIVDPELPPEPEEPVEGDPPMEDIPESEPVERVYETLVLWGINFRKDPNTDIQTIVYRMIPKGENIHVIQQIAEGWLMIEDNNGTIGYISSNPKYTDYAAKDQRLKNIDNLFSYGETFLGSPYVFGAKIGEQNEEGVRVFDCSSFVKTIFQDVLSVTLPRVSYDQATQGIEVPKEDIQRGDLVFFTSRSLPIGHVAVYAGNDQLLHTYSQKAGGVKYTAFSGTQWEDRFTTARRVY